jgi:DNA-binding PadR family transcriptional regulator
MARKKTKGTKLKVFSGRAADLNRVISKILEKKGALIAYDVWLQLRGIKGFKHTDSKTVYRRMQALEQQGWIAQKGTRPAKPGWDSTLYELMLRGKAALRLDEKSIEDFLRTATDEQLLKFVDLFS